MLWVMTDSIVGLLGCLERAVQVDTNGSPSLAEFKKEVDGEFI